MGKQSGIIRIIGAMEGMTFLQTPDGFITRNTTRLNKERMLTDPNFVRTLENSVEFTAVAHAGKYVRHALETLSKRCKDRKVSNRMMKLMTKIKNKDLLNLRGSRNPAAAMAIPSVKQMLRGFEFNDRAHLINVLSNAFVLDMAAGTITFTDLDVLNEINFPQAATHVTLRSGWAKVDLVNEVYSSNFSDAVELSRNAAVQTVVLSQAEPALAGMSVFGLQVQFWQVVNGVSYALSDGEFNALGIVGVE